MSGAGKVTRVERIGNAILFLGKWQDVLPNNLRVEAVISDPPYGQEYKVNTFHAGGGRDKAVMQRNGRSLRVHPNVHEEIDGDDEPFVPAPVLALAPRALLWGSHKFSHLLPQGRTLVWDKTPTGKVRSQGDGETAWTNVEPDAPLRIFRLLWDGLCVGQGARHEVTAGQKRHHPMQKPEILMQWCIQQAGDPASILDPYMGSGSTGVAALQMGRSFIGCESVPAYFEIACQRIANAQRQGRLLA